MGSASVCSLLQPGALPPILIGSKFKSVTSNTAVPFECNGHGRTRFIRLGVLLQLPDIVVKILLALVAVFQIAFLQVGVESLF